MDPDDALLPSVLELGSAADHGLTPRMLRGPTHHRLRRGAWAPLGTDPESAALRIAAVGAQLPEHGIIGGWSAAHIWEKVATRSDDLVHDGGPRWEEPMRRRSQTRPRPGGPARVVVCAPPGSRLCTREDVRVFRSVVPAEESGVVGPIRLTTPARSAFDMARLLSIQAAVIGLDRMIGLGMVGIDEVEALVRARRGWVGLPRARRVIGLVDGAAESPQESVLRLLWIDAGLPRPRCNWVVRTRSGRFVARVDLLDDDAGVVGEYDGAIHADHRRRGDDARRQEELEDLGLVVVRATAGDVSPAGAARWQQRLRATYRRAAHRTERGWVAAPL